MVKKITTKISYAHELIRDLRNNINCTARTPCYCYGQVCLRGGSCSSGNVYLRARPFYGKTWKNESASLVVCKQLGFRSVSETGTDRYVTLMNKH